MNDTDSPIITIPIPSHIPRGRGRYSTGKLGGNLRVRCSTPEYRLIEDEAKRLGLTISQFTRWSALRTAEALKHARGSTQVGTRSKTT